MKYRMKSLSLRHYGSQMFAENETYSIDDKVVPDILRSKNQKESEIIEEHRRMVRLGYQYVGGTRCFDRWIKK